MKYIPAVKVIDKHFNTVKYEMSWSNEAKENYQAALNEATAIASNKTKERNPIVRADGYEFPVPKYEPVVLKEVEMVEK